MFAEQKEHLESWPDCYLSEDKKAGYVALFHPKWKKTHTFYGFNDIKALEKVARSRKKDVYISLNAFEYGHRTADNLKQIRNIGIDLDCYNVNMSDVEAIERIKEMIYGGKIPNPNLVIRTSRGVQLIYTIEGGASPKMSPLSRYITSQLIGAMSSMGADTRCVDVSRVLRLPGSVHSKTNKTVGVEMWRSQGYTLQELYEFCTPLEHGRKRGRVRKGNIAVFQQKGINGFVTYNSKRITDFQKFVELRSGDLTGMRNNFLYIYAYTVALHQKTLADTEYFCYDLMKYVHSTIDKPMTKREMSHAIKSGFNDAMKFYDEYKARDFKMWHSPNDGVIRPMKTQTIVEHLGITDEESRVLETLHTSNEKKRRDREAKERQRRALGMKTIEEYNQERKNATTGNLERLRGMVEEGMSRTEMAETLGVSVYRIDQLKRKLKSL